MITRSRTSRSTTLFALLFTLLLAPVSAQDATPAATLGIPEIITNAAVVTPAARTNLGWDQQAADSLDVVAKELSITSQVAENAGWDDITPLLKDLKQDGAQLIICHADVYQNVCPEFAAAEGVKVAVIENPGAVSPLVSDIETEAQEVAYLAGVLAGLLTTSGTVGIVTSGEPPTWNYMTVGFAEGLKATNPDANLLYNVIGEGAYDDAAGAKRVTEQQLAAGADIIFGMGDGASFGMIEAIRGFNEKAESKDHPVRFIDVIGDKSADFSDVLLTSVVFDYSGIYKEMITDSAAGTFGKVYTMNIANDGVRLLDLPASVPQDVQDKIEQTRQQIVNGAIKVPAVADADGVDATLKELGYK